MVEFIDHSERVAMKEHWCGLCGGKIKKGEKHDWQKNKADGNLYDFRVHKRCSYLVELLDMFDRSNEDGLVSDDSFRECLIEEFDSLSTEDMARMMYMELR